MSEGYKVHILNYESAVYWQCGDATLVVGRNKIRDSAGRILPGFVRTLSEMGRVCKVSNNCSCLPEKDSSSEPIS